MGFPRWVAEPPLTLLKVGWVASRHDTDMAHAAVHAVAVAMARGRSADDAVGNFSEPGIVSLKPTREEANR